MKNLLKVAVFAALYSLVSYAETINITPGVYAPMHISEARYGFTKVDSDVRLALMLEGNGEAVMTLDYSSSGVPEHVSLKVYRTQTDACGSKHVYANLADQNAAMGGRYNVHFVDHTENVCDMVNVWLWEANVRMGFGWCGTGDSTMRLQGNSF